MKTIPQQLAGVCVLLAALAFIVWVDNHPFNFPVISQHIDAAMEWLAPN